MQRKSQAFWQEKVREWKAGKKSKTDFCREYGISRSSFHWWANNKGKNNPPPEKGKKEQKGKNLIQQSNFVEIASDREDKPIIKVLLTIRTSSGCVIEVPL